LAVTLKLYAVLGVRPVTVKVVAVVVPAAVVPFKTVYPATPSVESVEAVQLSDTVVPVAPVTAKPVGTVGGVVSGTESVVKLTGVLAAETLPAESLALTAKANFVAGASPVAVKLVVVLVPITVAPFKMSYPLTVAALSVDAVQLSNAAVVVMLVAVRPVGAVGPDPPAGPHAVPLMENAVGTEFVPLSFAVNPMAL
jgi:hypothetical protein